MSSNNDLSHVTSRFFDLFSSRAFSNATRSLPMAPVRAHWIRNVSTRQRHGPPQKKWFYSGIWVVSRQIQLHPLPGCTGQALLIQQLPAGASATVVAASSSCSLEPLEPFTLKLASFTSNVTYIYIYVIWYNNTSFWMDILVAFFLFLRMHMNGMWMRNSIQFSKYIWGTPQTSSISRMFHADSPKRFNPITVVASIGHKTSVFSWPIPFK